MEVETKIEGLERQIEQLKRDLMEIRGDYYKENSPTKMIITRDVQILGNLVQTSVNPTSTFGLVVTPVGRQANIAAPAGGPTIDTESRNAINSILSVLDTFGLTL